METIRSTTIQSPEELNAMENFSGGKNVLSRKQDDRRQESHMLDAALGPSSQRVRQTIQSYNMGLTMNQQLSGMLERKLRIDGYPRQWW